MDGVDEQLRVGVVGAGPWAQKVHAPGVADHPGTELTAVWARRPDAAAELAQRFQAEAIPDYDRFLSTVDSVAFAVPPAAQAELALRAAQAGKHLILDKPVAADVDAAVRLADAVGERDLVSVIMLTRRFAPETRDWLAELTRLGGWAGGSATWLGGALLGGDFAHSPWRWSDGALLDVGPHTIDLLDAALGPVTEVLGGTRSADDLCQLILGHESGATSQLALSLRLPIQPSIAEFAVYGEHGYRTLSGPFSPSQECYTALLDDFVAMVDSGTTQHTCDIQRGLYLQRILAKAAAVLTR